MKVIVKYIYIGKQKSSLYPKLRKNQKEALLVLTDQLKTSHKI